MRRFFEGLMIGFVLFYILLAVLWGAVAVYRSRPKAAPLCSAETTCAVIPDLQGLRENADTFVPRSLFL